MVIKKQGIMEIRSKFNSDSEISKKSKDDHESIRIIEFYVENKLSKQ